jgi:hypothetical protein
LARCTDVPKDVIKEAMAKEAEYQVQKELADQVVIPRKKEEGAKEGEALKGPGISQALGEIFSREGDGSILGFQSFPGSTLGVRFEKWKSWMQS